MYKHLNPVCQHRNIPASEQHQAQAAGETFSHYAPTQSRVDEYLNDLNSGCSRMFRVFLDNLANRV